MVCGISSVRLEPSRQMEIRGPRDCRLLSKALGGGGEAAEGQAPSPKASSMACVHIYRGAAPEDFLQSDPTTINVSRTQTHLGGVHPAQPYLVQMGKLGAGGMGFARNQARDSAESGWILGFPGTPPNTMLLLALVLPEDLCTCFSSAWNGSPRTSLTSPKSLQTGESSETPSLMTRSLSSLYSTAWLYLLTQHLSPPHTAGHLPSLSPSRMSAP